MVVYIYEPCFTGSHIAPERRPSELLSQAIQPPNLDNIGIAVKNLADIGALTGVYCFFNIIT